jgi:hypothetical protein
MTTGDKFGLKLVFIPKQGLSLQNNMFERKNTL